MSLIAIDYDGTITSDRETWVTIISILKLRGHEVIEATMRYESEPIDPIPGVMVYYTDRKAKGPALYRMGIKPDIWIDDNPGWIFQDSA